MNVSICNIKKSFGELLVLNDINLNIVSGSAFGLLGRNGAGKTTLIRIMMDVFPSDSGEILFDGVKLKNSDLRVGYLPEERGLYPRKIILEQLTYLGLLRGMKKNAAEKNIKYWLERMEMDQYLNKRLDTLSKGNQQKIQLAATLVNDPEVIILDEPFSGLDPVNSLMLKDIVVDRIKAGKVVIFSSHQMSYVEEFCDDVAIINKGKIVLNDNLRDVKRSYSRTKIKISFDNENISKQIDMLKSTVLSDIVENVSHNGLDSIINIKKADMRGELLTRLVQNNIEIERFEIIEPTLQEIFIEKAGD